MGKIGTESAERPIATGRAHRLKRRSPDAATRNGMATTANQDTNANSSGSQFHNPPADQNHTASDAQKTPKRKNKKATRLTCRCTGIGPFDIVAAGWAANDLRNAQHQLRAVTRRSIDRKILAHFVRRMSCTPLVRTISAAPMEWCPRENVSHKSDPPVRAAIRASKRKLSHAASALQIAMPD
jgi:hypothetical protein